MNETEAKELMQARGVQRDPSDMRSCVEIVAALGLVSAPGVIEVTQVTASPQAPSIAPEVGLYDASKTDYSVGND